MRTARFSASRTLLVAALVSALVGGVALTGCTKTSGSGSGTGAVRSEDMTLGQFPADNKPPKAAAPPPPMLTRPETAVYSYLVWISYAYRILNSDVASMTFDPYEEVRVNSYVELNRQDGRALDQRLIDYKVKSIKSVGDTSTVAATEQWVYRYIDTKTGKYKTNTLNASYDTTYTLVKNKDGAWVVAKVDAQSIGGPVK